MKTHRIAAIPGDGIGKEVIAAGIEALDALAKRDGGFALSFDHFDWGSDYYKKHGVMMPENGREQIRNHDAIFFGAVEARDDEAVVFSWVRPVQARTSPVRPASLLMVTVSMPVTLALGRA